MVSWLPAIFQQQHCSMSIRPLPRKQGGWWRWWGGGSRSSVSTRKTRSRCHSIAPFFLFSSPIQH